MNSLRTLKRPKDSKTRCNTCYYCRYLIESSMLDETKNNYLCSCCLLFDGLGLCFVDVSTGELYLTEFSENYDEKAVDELARFMPSEILMNKETSTLKRFCTFVSKKTEATAETLSSSEFDFEKCKNIVLSHFEKSSLDSLDLENKKVPFALWALHFHTYITLREMTSIT